MNVQFLKEVADIITPFMAENGFKTVETGLYQNEFKAYKVSYDEAAHSFTLGVAPVDVDGNADGYTILNTWYFDESSHGPKDTQCIGEDFLAGIAADTGIKVIKNADGSSSDVAMPTKAALGTEPGIEAFTQKFLAMFPQYKDTYKESVAKYGSFLFVNFYKNYGIAKMKELMADEAANKKALTKYWNMLGDMHYEGELLVGDVICTVIIAGAFGENPAAFPAIADKYLADYPFLKSAAIAAVNNYKSSKSLQKALKV